MTDCKRALIEYFMDGINDADDLRLGIEVEYFPVYESTGESVPYSGENGVRALVGQMMKLYPEARPIIEEDLFGFHVPEFSITLEPGSQIEISIAPKKRIREIEDIHTGFITGITPLLEKSGIRFVNAGCIPKTPESLRSL